MKYQLLFIFTLCVIHIHGYQMYCGRRLSDVLAYLCNPPLTNETSTDKELSKRSINYKSTTEDLQRHRHRQASRIRRKRQIISECCHNPCSIDQLMTYC